MLVFVGMETSGAMRRAFQDAGHEVYSCDLLPAKDGETVWHIQGEVFATLDELAARGWVPDLAIFHPDCTYLTNSAAWAFNDPDFERYPGVGYHQKVKPGTLTGVARRMARVAALWDVRRIIDLPIRRKVIENPIGAIGSSIRKPSQIVQPYEFGDNASKATCFWYIGENGEDLPGMRLPLDPAARVPGRPVPFERAMLRPRKAGDPEFVERWDNQTDTGQNRLSPSADRWDTRSATYPGIAAAAAKHWL